MISIQFITWDTMHRLLVDLSQLLLIRLFFVVFYVCYSNVVMCSITFYFISFFVVMAME